MYKIGKQYTKDDVFKTKARLHQSEYRVNVLDVDYDEYGNRLMDESGKTSFNYYEGLNCREELGKRYSNYSKKRDADMLRNEHIPFNLFAPLKLNLELARDILSDAFKIETFKS